MILLGPQTNEDQEYPLEKTRQITAVHKQMLNAKVWLDPNYTQAKNIQRSSEASIERDGEKTDSGDGKISCEQYKRITLDYLISFFGNRDIDDLTPRVHEEYERHRNEAAGKELGYSSVREHKVTLNRMFEEAILRGNMTTTQKLHLENKEKV